MADRFPLIVDSSAQQLQELAVGDNLNLASSGLINADNIQTSGLSVGVMTATSFIGDGSQLTNLPAAGSSTELTASGTLADGDTTIVNADGTVSAVSLEATGWIATLGGTGDDRGRGIAVDSSGNVYVAGQSDSTSNGFYDILITKYNTSGTIQWQRTLGGTNGDIGYEIAVDSSGNVYVAGESNGTGAGGMEALIVKYNASGTIQWQRTLGGTDTEFGRGIAFDSSGNVYVAGSTRSTGAGTYDFLIAKYNTSGTIQWQRTLGGTDRDEGQGIAVDSSGNVYVTGRCQSAGAGSIDVLIAKYNTSGAIQWQRTLGGTDIDFSLAIAVDSSDNVYVTGYTDVAGLGQEFLIAKYNSSGTIQWQRTLGGTGSDIGYGIAVDSSGDVYAVGQTTSAGAGNYDILIAKYNASGTIQWQRTLGGTNREEGKGIAVDNSGNVYVTGLTESAGAGSYDLLIAKLPDDGSGTGTYGDLTYATSSLTDSASSLTSQGSSLTNSTSSLTSSTSSLTDSATSLTSATTTVGSTNLTSENYIGISDGAYTNGQTATIQLIGSVDDAQSGLTPGQKYYVQGDGTLSTTAGSPSVLAGKAISSTKLAIKG